MSIRIHKIDDNLLCTCGHPWKEHSSVKVIHPEYATYPLNIKGFVAEACQHVATDKYFHDYGDTYCICQNFNPRAANVRKLVLDWSNRHE